MYEIIFGVHKIFCNVSYKSSSIMNYNLFKYVKENIWGGMELKTFTTRPIRDRIKKNYK